MTLTLILIALLEGVTEFLPISSTAHLIILGKLLALDLADPYIKFYLLAIQCGALIAGFVFYAKKIVEDRVLLRNVAISFLPSAAVGFVFYKLFKKLLEGNFLLMAGALILGGIIFIILERVEKNKVVSGSVPRTTLTKTDAFVVGLAQALAIVPGVSRSGITIIAGMYRGIAKATIIEYTFLLALPTLGAASLYDAYKSRAIFSAIDTFGPLVLGIFVAFLSAGVTLYFLRFYLARISLTYFGWYRIALGILIVLFFVI
jgi:undecaprenyl-diphosphatase